MKLRRSTALFLILTLLVLLAGCGSSKSAARSEYYVGEAAVEAPMAYADYDMAVAETAAASMSAENGTGSLNLPEGRKFIITGNMEAETDDLDALLAGLNAKIAALSGYIEDQSIYNGSTYSSRRYRSASMTVRIPVAQLAAFTEEVQSAANVVSNSQSTMDVTLQYVDTQSRVTALETEQTRLLELLAKAEDMSDLLEIEARLTEVRYQLEQYASHLRVLDNQIDYATIYLSLKEVQEYTPVAEQTLGERIRDGFVGTLKDLGEGIEDLIAWLIIDLPYFVIFGLVIWAAVVITRKCVKKQKAKKMAKLAAQYQARVAQQNPAETRKDE